MNTRALFLNFIISGICFHNCLEGFDWKFYLNKYPDLKKQGITDPQDALVHFITTGIRQHRQSAEKIENTNFDWKYYIEANKLAHIKTEDQAKRHYQKIGAAKKLPYCKKFNIGILFHLYNLKQLNKFIYKINSFIRMNSNNTFYIKINIPVGRNINHLTLKRLNLPALNTSLNYAYKNILDSTPYHKSLITHENCKVLYQLKRYISSKINIPPNRLQIMFSENRGVDIGGFFLLMDQVIKQKLPIDYLVKIHTKSFMVWREVLTSILNIRVNKLLREYSYIGTCSIKFNWNDNRGGRVSITKRLLSRYGLPRRDFDFFAGTMFIISSKFLDFFKPYDRLKIFNSMPKGYPRTYYSNAHGYERIFGYLGKHLKLKTKILDYIPPRSILRHKIVLEYT